MYKKKSELKGFACAHCGEEFPFDATWCECCKDHMHKIVRGQGVDCVSCLDGLTREGESKYGPFKPS